MTERQTLMREYILALLSSTNGAAIHYPLLISVAITLTDETLGEES